MRFPTRPAFKIAWESRRFLGARTPNIYGGHFVAGAGTDQS